MESIINRAKSIGILNIRFLVLGILFCCSGGYADDVTRLRSQYVEYCLEQSVSDRLATKYIESMRSDGSWDNVDYANSRTGGWPALAHLNRIERMAQAYADPDSNYYRDDALKEDILSGLQHWLDKDYRNKNWWYKRIGVPKSILKSFVLLGDDLPQPMLKQAQGDILARTKMGMTGQNKVWCAGIAFLKALLKEDAASLKAASDEIWSEVVVSTKEGIQPDWSFHQHGPQQQFGNYGLSFGSDIMKWGSVMRGTAYAMPPEKLDIIRNYLLEGPAWILWNGNMDLSGCGRQVDPRSQQGKGGEIQRQLKKLAQIDPSCRRAVDLRLAQPNELIGFRPFWRSEMAVQRQPEWYASLKMSSSRVIGSETHNLENVLGLHLGDGVLLLRQSGEEYEDIVPVWDWKRLPGTTCDQGMNNLKPTNKESKSDYAGVMGDSESGIAAMIYKRGGLKADKAWFFFDDEIICIGAGITGETKGPVYTSIQQSWKSGEVKQGNGWVHHDGIGYQYFGKPKPVGKAGEVRGNWNLSFPSRGNRPVSGGVFSLWFDHGPSPKNKEYAYRIIPTIPVEEMEKPAMRTRCRLLSNTTTVQAVERDGKVYAVFYEAGTLNLGRRKTISVSGPCMLMVSKESMIASDPTHSLTSVDINLNQKRTYTITFPDGAERGKQAELK